MNEEPYVRQDVFTERMSNVSLSIEHVREEIRSFKRFCTTVVLIGVPLLSTIVQLAFQAYGK